jgi:hypothetical protein
MTTKISSFPSIAFSVFYVSRIKVHCGNTSVKYKIPIFPIYFSVNAGCYGSFTMRYAGLFVVNQSL